MTVFYASPTRLALWRQCRRRYKFRYLDGLPTRDWPWLSFGQSVHAALKEFFDLGPETRTWERLERSFRRNWVRKGYAGEEEERAYFERGLAALRRVFESEDARAPRPRLLEFSVQELVGDVVLCGKMDRVDDTPEGLVLTDYKTGRPRAPEEAQADQAFTMYALLLRARFKRPPVRLVWDFVETGDRVVTARAPEALDRAKEDLLRLVAEVRAATEFPPSPGPLCATCDFLERCPEGARAVGGAPGAVSEPPAELLPGPGED